MELRIEKLRIYQVNKQGMGKGGKEIVDVFGERQIILCNRENEELCNSQVTWSSLDSRPGEQ